MAIRKAKTERPATLTRVAKFQIKPTNAQLATLQKVSDNLWLLWNEALAKRNVYFEEHLQPLYEQLKEAGVDETRILREKIKELYKDAPDYFSQAKDLTTLRNERTDFAAVPCPWQQETLKLLDGGFKSFMQLRVKGDQKARPPRVKSEHEFCEIQGVNGFQLQVSLPPDPEDELLESVGVGKKLKGYIKFPAQVWLTPEKQNFLHTSAEGCSIILSPGKALPGGAMLSFPLPLYQQFLLSQAVKLNKFTIVRDGKGRFWCSIAYAIEKPATVELVPEKAVFITLGASFIGVVSDKGEETIDLWRPDQYWMPKITAKKQRRDRCTKGSRQWCWLTNQINRDYERMRNQQLDNQRKVVTSKLRKHGVHFVIAEHSPIRAKKGKLADKQKLERGGELGLNWLAQNTGSLARLRQILEQKAAEWGGSVSSLRLQEYPLGMPREKKVPAAIALRAQYLEEAT